MKLKNLIFAFISLNCFADPFYSDEVISSQADEFQQNTAKNLPNLTACLPSSERNLLYLDLPFNQLKLIGIVRINNIFRALFNDNQRQIIDLRIGDLIEPEQIEIVEINLKQVRYIAWQKVEDCDNPTIQTFRF